MVTESDKIANAIIDKALAKVRDRKPSADTGFNLERFTISVAHNGYYNVSIPNYEGGSVVRAEVYDELLQRIATQAESLSTCHDLMKLQKEAIEAAIRCLQGTGDKTIDQVKEQLRNSITPKGETK